MRGIQVKDATVVITGASGSSGQAIAEAFAAAGAHLVLAARDIHPLNQLVERCRAMGVRVQVVATEASDTAAALRLVSAAREFGGRIDIWVSTAGADRRVSDAPIRRLVRGVETDPTARRAEAHAVAAAFRRQRRGIFINTVFPPDTSEALRAELSGHRNIHVCDISTAFPEASGDNAAESRRVADAVLRLAHNPKPVTRLGASSSLTGVVAGLASVVLALARGTGLSPQRSA